VEALKQQGAATTLWMLGQQPIQNAASTQTMFVILNWLQKTKDQ